MVLLDSRGQVSTLNGPLNIDEAIIDLRAGLEHYALLTKHGRPELTRSPFIMPNSPGQKNPKGLLVRPASQLSLAFISEATLQGVKFQANQGWAFALNIFSVF